MSVRQRLLSALGVVRRPPARGTALAATMACLRRVLAASHDGGCAARFAADQPSGPADVATTGVVIEALCAHAAQSGESEWRALAGRSAHWIAAVAGDAAQRPIPDATAAVKGLAAFLASDADARVVSGARLAALSLLQQLDAAERTRRGAATRSLAHVAAAAAALEVLGRTGGAETRDASIARLALDEVVAGQSSSGWLEQGAQHAESRAPAATLPGLADAIGGLLEAAGLLNESRYAQAAMRAGEGLMRSFEVRRGLGTEYRDGWRPVPDRWLGRASVSTTAYSRTAVAWLALARFSGQLPFLSAACKANDVVSAVVESGDGYAGAVDGLIESFPATGRRRLFPAAAAHHACALIAEDAAASALLQRHAPSGS